MQPTPIPLERALSRLGAASRSTARDLIRAGRVIVDGAVVADPLAPCLPESARIRIDGKPLQAPRWTTIAFHKPRGVVTSRFDKLGRPRVEDFLRDVGTRVIPVGRLDFATSGLLLLTNDTRLADFITEPGNRVRRAYVVTVRGEFSDASEDRLRAGIDDRGERLTAEEVILRKRSRRESHLVLHLTEGKNREVRRMMEALGHEVTRLKRISFGGIVLGDLRPGTWRPIEVEEARSAFPGAPIAIGRTARGA